MRLFDKLEARRLMAVTGPYIINGTPGPDVISVSYDPPAMIQMKLDRAVTRAMGGGGAGGGTEKAYITVNGHKKTVQIPQTQAIIINGLEGDDLIEVSGNHTVEIHAGAGNDRVFGGPRNDLILGDAGHDIINAGLGNDTVRGGADGDELHGNGDDDVIYADGGGDAMFGDAGADKLYGGADNDNIHGGDGPDIIMAVGGGSGDVTFGDSGYDSFWVDDKPTEVIGDANISEMAINLHRVNSFEWPKLPVFTQVMTRSAVKRGFGFGGLGGKLGGFFDSFPDPVAPGYTYQNFSDKPLFGNGGPMPEDIRQGQVGDCYFMAGLSAVAKISPNYIKQSVAEMGDGTFAIRMYDINHKAHYLRVDADLPVNSWGGLAYAGFGVNNTIWAPILEKAYAFFRKGEGTYASISGGWPEHTYRALGMRTTVLASTTYNTPEKMIQAIRDLWANGNAVSFVTKNNAPVLVGLHVYMVDRLITDAAGVTSVVLRNPWGSDGRTVDNNFDGTDDGYVTLRADQLFTAYDQVAGGRM
jgi:hypothetical protein